MDKLGVVIPVLNQFIKALECLDSVRTKLCWNFYFINNSKYNRGVAKAWNEGVRRAIDDGCNYIAILNDDILLAPDTLDEMIYFISATEDCGVVTGSDLKESIYYEDIYTWRKSRNNAPNELLSLVVGSNYACFLLTQETYRHIGAFDENFYPAYFEDCDYSYRTILSGLRVYGLQSAGFYHFHGQTNKSAYNNDSVIVDMKTMEKNKNYYISKWGGNYGKELFKTPFNDPGKRWDDW